jgi:hypothetical protein
MMFLVLQTVGGVMGFISAALFCLAAYQYIVLQGKEKDRVVLRGLIAYAAHLVSLIALALLMARFETQTQRAAAFAVPVLLLVACAYFAYRGSETRAGRRLLASTGFLMVSYLVAFAVPRVG